MHDKIKCELCGLECSMQVSASHLRAKHDMTTAEYRALGYKTLSPARLAQLRNTPVGRGEVGHHSGPDHWNWKGGHVASAGYRIAYRNGKRHYEHRLIAEDMIGRPLKADEIVHHIDGNRSNNAPENLVVMSRGKHDQMKEGPRRYHHVTEDCEDAAIALLELGWSKSKIRRALRIHHATLTRWLEKHSKSQS